MVNKREHSEDEFEEEPALSVASSTKKRVRLSSLPASTPPPLPSSSKGDDGGEPMDQDGAAASGDEEDEDMPEDEEEEKFVTQGIEELKKKDKREGLIAKSGIIEEVDLVDFMCHTKASIKFGPQVNFLVGNNGSGKSAILTGITMALGGNARATNRAGKGSGLIKTGSSMAICTVRLKNQGSDAYKPATYGKSITIERRLKKDGTGSYTIRNEEMKVVDSKKATLDAILDHFNIQVDNPMTVLTQDQSRQFLANSSAKDKYNFFLRGTQLAQLTTEYEVIRLNLESMTSTLERKTESIPEIKEKYKRAKQRATEASAAIGQQDRIEILKNELAWSFVDDVEISLATGQDFLSKEERTKEKIEAQLETYKTDLASTEEEIAVIDEGIAEQTTNAEARTLELTQLRAELKEHSNRMKAFKDDERTTKSTMQRLTDSIAHCDKQIEAERVKLERDVDAERAPMIARLEELKEEVGKLSVDATRSTHGAEDDAELREKLLGDLVELKNRIHAASQDAQLFRQRIDNLNNAKKNPLFAFGAKVPNLVNAINTTHGWIKKPIGPIGMFINLRDAPISYGPVIESVFGELLNGFIVETDADKSLLYKLCKDTGATQGIPIIKQQRDDNFDYSAGEPPEGILTIRRILDISNPHVESVVIVSNHIEKAALVPARADGDVFMRNRPPNIESCFSSDSYRIGGGDGGSASVAMNEYKGARRLSPDTTGQIANVQRELDTVQALLQTLHTEKQELDQRIGAVERARSEKLARARQNASKIVRLNKESEHLHEKLREEQPSNLAAIEDMKKEAQAELDSISEQYAALKEQMLKVGAAAKPWIDRKDELTPEAEKTEKFIKKLQSQIDELHRKKLQTTSAIQQYQKKLLPINEKIAKFEMEIAKLQATLEERIEQASSICARPKVDKKKKPAKIQQDIEALERALKEREKRQGASVAEIMAEVAQRKRECEEAISAAQGLKELNERLHEAYQNRIERWSDFRDSISTRAKLGFGYHLSTRGFSGKLQFSHEKGTLSLRVQTDSAQNGTQGGRQKDAKSLSGGEKSFSTICLLLTMWEAVGCPLRCLDEFDVFMDAVNRRISMRMMIDTAKASDATQFVLITPQAMGTLTWGPEVRVARLPDPVRGQGTLQMGA